ncbi:MAG TPA: nuclear transport factor 2 family protein [Gaiellaceae bacterium]|nr:nuclear transport factor 2 family protein [Gaiellaceae bacterium]
MTGDALADAHEILALLQAKIDSRDADELFAFFEEPAVLIGSAGDGRDTERRRRYLTALATQPESLFWDWQEAIPFYESDDALGFAAFGEVAVSDAAGEQRYPIRASLLGVRSADGWRLRHFHGSIPASF